MAFTGKLGTNLSKPGNMKLATRGGAPPVGGDLILGSLAQLLIGQFPNPVSLNSTTGFSVGSTGTFFVSITFNSTTGFVGTFTHNELASLTIAGNSSLAVNVGALTFFSTLSLGQTSGLSVFPGGSTYFSSLSLSQTAGFSESFLYYQTLSTVVLSSNAQLSGYYGITSFVTLPSTTGMLLDSMIANATAVQLSTTGGFSVSSSPTTFQGAISLSTTAGFTFTAGFYTSPSQTIANTSSGFLAASELSISLPPINSTTGFSVSFIYGPGAFITFPSTTGFVVVSGFTGSGGAGQTQSANAGIVLNNTIITGKSAGNNLTFTQILTFSRTVFPKNTLTINQTVIGGKTIRVRISTFYQPTQSISKTAIFNRNPTNTLPFNQTFVKQTSFGIFNIPQVIGTVVPKIATVRLSVPGRLVVLRAPVFGDSQNYTNSVSVKRCMQGDYFTYTKKPGTQVLKYKFEMGRIKSLELRDFLFNFSDQVVKLENWRGETWMGHITNNPFIFTAKGRYFNDREQVDLDLEFEGVQIA